MPPDDLFVLDTSALLALRGDEPGSERVESLLLRAPNGRCRVFVSFMTRLEVLYTVWRREGEEAGRDALRLIDSFNIEWVSCDPEILSHAARLKATERLSLADSWIAATTICKGAILVHKDPEFTPVKELRQEFLKAQ